MKTNNQHNQIIDLHRSGEWVCSTAIEYMRDARKRISELNHLGYTFEAKPCDGRCGKQHNSRLFMRRLKSVPQGNIQPVKETIERATLTKACCASILFFKTHSRDCQLNKVVENSLF